MEVQSAGGGANCENKAKSQCDRGNRKEGKIFNKRGKNLLGVLEGKGFPASRYPDSVTQKGGTERRGENKA